MDFDNTAIQGTLVAAGHEMSNVVQAVVEPARIETGQDGRSRLVNPVATVLFLHGALDCVVYKRVLRGGDARYIAWPTPVQEELATDAFRELAYAVRDELLGRFDASASVQVNAQAMFGDLSRMGHLEAEQLYEQFAAVVKAGNRRNYETVAAIQRWVNHRAVWPGRDSQDETPFGVFALVRALWNESDTEGNWLTETTVGDDGVERETPVWVNEDGAAAWALARTYRQNDADVSSRKLSAHEVMLCMYLFSGVARQHDELARTPEVLANEAQRNSRRSSAPNIVQEPASAESRTVAVDLDALAAAM